MARKRGPAIPCKALTKAGHPCSCFAMAGDPDTFCFAHSRQAAEKRRRSQVYGGTQSAKRKSTLMMEKVTGELVTIDDKRPVSIEDLSDLKQYALDKMTAIEKRSHDGDISTRDSAELRKWSDFLLKVQIAGGLGAMDRIYQLEQALEDYDAQAVKLRPGAKLLSSTGG